ncbi:MAG: hypothetical protein HY803_12775 [candidate division NC10 bacterium]|nr:hypothetical protein [candidate division NC10 bacterium]
MPLENICVDPEVLLPGQHLRVSATLPTGMVVEPQAMVQLLNAARQVVVESLLVLQGDRIEATLHIPPTAEEGPYDVVVLSQDTSFLLAPVIVLSGKSLMRLKEAVRADQKRSEAYDLAAKNNLEQAVELLSSAEGLYRDHSLEDLEATTTLEKVYVLEKAGRGVDQEDLLKAMTKFHIAGLQNQRSLAFGKAWLYY